MVSERYFFNIPKPLLRHFFYKGYSKLFLWTAPVYQTINSTKLYKNVRLDQQIRQKANDEFNSRNLSMEEVQQLILKHDAQFVPEKEEGLDFKYRLLLIVCPFFIELHSLIAGRMLAKGQKSKWKVYWIYLCVGYLLWSIGIILFAKHYLFRVHADSG